MYSSNGMVGTVVLAATLAQDPLSVLGSLRDAYRKLDTYSATIEHHDSSGLFPGEYTQSLKWRRGNRFELIVIKPVAQSGSPSGRQAPNFFSNGSKVVEIRGSDRRERSLAPEQNSSPGWEVSGGVVMLFLSDSPNAKTLFEGRPEFPIEWKQVDEVKWRGEKVSRISAIVNKTLPIRLYFADKPLRLVGQEYEEGRTKHWMRYVSQDFSPQLPANLGEPPNLYPSLGLPSPLLDPGKRPGPLNRKTRGASVPAGGVGRSRRGLPYSPIMDRDETEPGGLRAPYPP